MSSTPPKHRSLTRQRSAPSIAIGIPPSLPDHLLPPITPPYHIKPIRTPKRIHRGDVSSSAPSSSGDTDTEEESRQSTPQPALIVTPTRSPTSKRRVIGTMEPMSVGRAKAGSKRDTLQSRLQAVAKVRPSQSLDTLHAIPPVPPLPGFPASPSRVRVAASNLLSSPEKTKQTSRNDKVIVCVRYVAACYLSCVSDCQSQANRVPICKAGIRDLCHVHFFIGLSPQRHQTGGQSREGG